MGVRILVNEKVEMAGLEPASYTRSPAPDTAIPAFPFPDGRLMGVAGDSEVLCIPNLRRGTAVVCRGPGGLPGEGSFRILFLGHGDPPARLGDEGQITLRCAATECDDVIVAVWFVPKDDLGGQPWILQLLKRVCTYSRNQCIPLWKIGCGGQI